MTVGVITATQKSKGNLRVVIFMPECAMLLRCSVSFNSIRREPNPPATHSSGGIDASTAVNCAQNTADA
jgi:hypothetical protein